MSNATIYKIRHKKTGLFSGGGSCPRWAKKGKAWSSIAYVKSHLACVDQPRYPMFRGGHPYADAEIVTFEMVVVDTRDVAALLDEVELDKVEKKVAKEIEALRRQEEREKEELQRLRKKVQQLHKKWPDV